VTLYLHAGELGRPDIAPIARERLYSACYRGEMPAEALDTSSREDLVYALWTKGWTDVEIAAHTRMSTYTTARIRTQIGLDAQQRREEDAA
jgi:hypothetical protein